VQRQAAEDDPEPEQGFFQERDKDGYLLRVPPGVAGASVSWLDVMNQVQWYIDKNGSDEEIVQYVLEMAPKAGRPESDSVQWLRNRHKIAVAPRKQPTTPAAKPVATYGVSGEPLVKAVDGGLLTDDPEDDYAGEDEPENETPVF
jgi:hypothetical protein